MTDPKQRAPLTLEDLLHLKRAERPSPDFWVRFESELRQKQLSALLERRPWWQSFPSVLTQRKAFMSLSATALLAITLISVRLYSPAHVVRLEPQDSEPIAPSVQNANAPVGTSVVAHSEAQTSPVFAADTDLNNDSSTASAVPLSDRLPEHAAELTPWSAPMSAQSPSAMLLTSHSEPVERLDPSMTRALSAGPMLISSEQMRRSDGAGAELASVSAMASKRSRLLAQFNDRQFTPDPQAPALVRERLTRRLASTDASLSDHYARVGFKGDQVSLRF